MKPRHAISTQRGSCPLLEILEGRMVPAGFADFNGDGYGDLAIGVPYEDLGEVLDAGAVNVIYGTAAGLAYGGDQVWSQDSEGIRGVTEEDDRFGSCLAWGDFDNDGFTDLAIGIPGQDVKVATAAGAVQILYGSSNGLSSTGNQIFTQNTSGILDTAEEWDSFGSALAAGDFNGDGFADLAIGAPGENVGTVIAAGAVNILFGSASGLVSAGNQIWHQNKTGILDAAEASDTFGASLAVGYFNDDAYADLAIGVPGEGIKDVASAGAVHVLYGSGAGLAAANNQFWTQADLGSGDAPETKDLFGSALAAADFNGDGTDDLAVGTPLEDFDGLSDAGIVQVIYSSVTGLAAGTDQIWHRNIGTIEGDAADSDLFGQVLVAGDFNGDGFAELLIGVPSDTVETDPREGSVSLIFGSSAGLTDTDNFMLDQSLFGSSDGPDIRDFFGWALAKGDYNGDGRFDLAVGAWGENNSRGVVHVLYSGPSGLTPKAGEQTWSQDSTRIEGISEEGDEFGWALS